MHKGEVRVEASHYLFAIDKWLFDAVKVHTPRSIILPVWNQEIFLEEGLGADGSIKLPVLNLEIVCSEIKVRVKASHDLFAIYK